MEKKFNIVVGEDGTVKLPDAVLEKLEVKPGEEVRFEVDDNFYAVRLLSRIEAERLDYLNWMHNKHCPSTISNSKNAVIYSSIPFRICPRHPRKTKTQFSCGKSFSRPAAYRIHRVLTSPWFSPSCPKAEVSLFCDGS